jgi:nucleoside-diphosphate-sugar epimerase
MARALIVGCGCRGRQLGARLLEEGWAVRGTTRREEGLAAIEAAGLDAALADPGRIGTVLDLVGDVALVVWLLGSAEGSEEELSRMHGDGLAHLLERLVDTPVRGVLYEAAGSVDGPILSGGSEVVRGASERWRIPAATVAEPFSPTWAEAVAQRAVGLVNRYD